MRLYTEDDYSNIDKIMSDLDMDTTTNDSNSELQDYTLEDLN
jgi:hypothetical protein